MIIQEEINRIKPKWDKLNKKLKLTPAERVEKAYWGHKLYDLYIKRITELQELEMKLRCKKCGKQMTPKEYNNIHNDEKLCFECDIKR